MWLIMQKATALFKRERNTAEMDQVFFEALLCRFARVLYIEATSSEFAIAPLTSPHHVSSSCLHWAIWLLLLVVGPLPVEKVNPQCHELAQHRVCRATVHDARNEAPCNILIANYFHDNVHGVIINDSPKKQYFHTLHNFQFCLVTFLNFPYLAQHHVDVAGSWLLVSLTQVMLIQISTVGISTGVIWFQFQRAA